MRRRTEPLVERDRTEQTCKMFLVILVVCSAVLCYADVQQTTPAQPTTPPPVFCGQIPTSIYKCLGNPKLITATTLAQCNKQTTECDRMKCFFTKSGWMNGDMVDQTKLIAHFDQFAKDHPDWAPAVQHTKTECLTGPLQPLGVTLSCPAYDIIHCAMSTFIKNATPSQWSTSAECTYPRQFAAACPICPDDCFAAAIPYGSCNACKLLPRSP